MGWNQTLDRFRGDGWLRLSRRGRRLSWKRACLLQKLWVRIRTYFFTEATTSGEWSKVSLRPVIAIDAPMIYTAPYVMFLMRTDPLRGQVEGDWALEIETFLGPEMATPPVPYIKYCYCSGGAGREWWPRYRGGGRETRESFSLLRSCRW